jgi:cytochrome c553
MMTRSLLYTAALAALLAGCKAGGDNPGLEYAPNMYHSVAYEPLSQITDEDAGTWVNSLDNGRGEYFNSNKYNPYRMNMREPAPYTVKRDPHRWLPYRQGRVSKDSIDIVTANLKNPLDSTAAHLETGKALYYSYCQHCHGAKGEGDGLVAEKYAGVANLKGDSYLNMSEAHVFQVITHGAGLMGAHGSQVSPEDRWKIAMYVKALQKQK